MGRLKKIIVTMAGAVGVLLVLYVIAMYAFTALTSRFGSGWVLMVTHPRDAYTIRRGARELEWQGMHIRVDSDFVLTRRGPSLVASHINRALWMLGPGVTFVDAEGTNGAHFASEEEWCASATDRCTVHPLAENGRAVCLTYRGTREKVWTKDIEVWRCRSARGIEARFAGRARELSVFRKIVHDAFATAPAADALQVRPIDSVSR